MKCGILSTLAALLLMTSLGTKADYWLVTFNLDAPTADGQTYQRVAYERFIGHIDCRERGSKNVHLMQALGIRGGFVCVNSLEE